MKNVLKTNRKNVEIKHVMTVKSNVTINLDGHRTIPARVGTLLEVYRDGKNGVISIYSGHKLVTVLMEKDFEKLLDKDCFDIVKIHLIREKVDA